MTKIFNNVTTRSNTFAVWMTVGFFEVTDETAVPPKLGAEINLTTNRNIRHRMFSIIDRSSINLVQTLATSAAPVPGAGSQTVTPSAMSGTVTLNGNIVPWSIQEGSLLVIDQGTAQEEMVVVTQVGPPAPAPPTSFAASFTRAHGPNFRITLAGNPGPQPQFDPRSQSYWDVVPYYAIID